LSEGLPPEPEIRAKSVASKAAAKSLQLGKACYVCHTCLNLAEKSGSERILCELRAQIKSNATITFARAYFVNVHHFRGLCGNRFPITAAVTATKIVWAIIRDQSIILAASD
jgi:hypothetical protein